MKLVQQTISSIPKFYILTMTIYSIFGPVTYYMQLIKETNIRIKVGNELINKSGEVLEKVLLNTKQTVEMVKSVTHTIREQNTSSQEIQRAIEESNQVTQQNSTLVQEVAAASSSLDSEAEKLQNNFNKFKV